MRAPLGPREEAAIRAAFDQAQNMSPQALHAWLDTPESRKVGVQRKGEAESIGRQSARRILAIRATPCEALTESDYQHMRKVVGYVRRHRAQRPWGDVTHTRWRWSLMNWGHDPLIGEDAARG